MDRLAGPTRKKKGQTAGDLMAEEIMANPQLRQDILSWSAKLYDRYSITTKKARARAKAECMKVMRGAHPEWRALSDEALYPLCFAPDVVVAEMTVYINAVARSKIIRGKLHEEMSVSTFEDASHPFGGGRGGRQVTRLVRSLHSGRTSSQTRSTRLPSSLALDMAGTRRSTLR